MSTKTIIKYNVEGCRMFKIPIITIIPVNNSDIIIRICFPGITDIIINSNEKVIIKQVESDPYPHSDLLANNKIISNTKGFFDNGTIIINGNCVYEETYETYYDT